jgi:hypothetical protein
VQRIEHRRNGDRVVVLILRLPAGSVFRLVLDGVAELFPTRDVFLDTVEAEHVAFNPDVIVERGADGFDDSISSADTADNVLHHLEGVERDALIAALGALVRSLVDRSRTEPR